MLEGVTIEQLRTLRAVAEAGTFSGAARKLGRVQAAVSQSIERLEAQIGLRLFDRSGRIPRLTHHGEAIVVAAAEIMGGVVALEDLVKSLKQGTETALSIVVDVTFPTESLVAFAKDFAKTHPAVELVLYTEVLSAVTAHVRDKRAAWGIALEDADLSDLERRPIADVRLVPVAARTHPLAKRRGTIDAAGLRDAVQIVLGERAVTKGDHGIFSKRTWRVVDLAAKHALIAGGLGWGHMPEHVVRDDLAAGRLVELSLDAWQSGGPRRSLVLVWNRGAIMGPVARWAQERISKLCRKALDPSNAAHHTA